MNRLGTVTIQIPKKLLAELSAAEAGAYDDAASGRTTGRPLESHTHKIAQRFASRLVITSKAEAEDVYYAVCSGTFQSQSIACWNVANRIADNLRPYVKPETVARWPAPYDKPNKP